jgi:hypoxanthine phosphoribosyltransferase
MWEKSDIREVLVTEEEIQAKAKQIGEQITKDYEGEQPLLVGLLRGSIPFMADLIKNIDLDIQFDTMDVSSYEGTESVGQIRIVKDLDTAVKGLDIILVEDIVDTGKTLYTIKAELLHRGAKSVKIATLLNKSARRVLDIEADYIGFEVPDEFVVGYGMDFNQKYRCLPYIGVLKKECYEK